MPGTAQRIQLGNLSIDLATYEVRVNGVLVKLTPLEFDLLAYLARHQGTVIDVASLAKMAWLRGKGSPNSLRVLVTRLRGKLRDSEPWQIITVRTRGYGLVASRPSAGGQP